VARPKSEDKRNAILDAATRVLRTASYGRPNVRDIETGRVAEGTLFSTSRPKMI